MQNQYIWLSVAFLLLTASCSYEKNLKAMRDATALQES